MTEGAIDILLVEDNADDLELALYAFQKHRLANRVKVVRDGAEALTFIYGEGMNDGAGDRLPRLILLDLKLPKVNGIEVLRRLKSDARTRTIPVVVLTSSREDVDIAEAYHLGVNSYIVKPVDFERFIDAVRQLGFYWLLINQPPIHRQ